MNSQGLIIHYPTNKVKVPIACLLHQSHVVPGAKRDGVTSAQIPGPDREGPPPGLQ